MKDAETLRDAGLTRVIENEGEWKLAAHQTIRRIMSGSIVTGESVREMVEVMIGPAHHHNVWGSLIMTAVRDGVLKPTGEWRKGKNPKGHARQVRVYVRA